MKSMTDQELLDIFAADIKKCESRAELHSQLLSMHLTIIIVHVKPDKLDEYLMMMKNQVLDAKIRKADLINDIKEVENE